MRLAHRAPVLLGLGVLGLLGLGLLPLACSGEAPPEPPPPAPKGSLRVQWTLKDAKGADLSCEDLEIISVEVRTGGEPRAVACDDGQTVFTDLLPDRYPVFVRLKVESGMLAEKVANAIVEADKETVSVADFVFDRDANKRGSVRLRWSIAGDPPARGCGEIGASTFYAETRAASISQFTRTATCSAGQLKIDDLPLGGYEVYTQVRDPDGTPIASSLVPFQVMAGMTTEPQTINFAVPNLQTATVIGLWTLSGSTAVDGCAALGGDTMHFRNVVEHGQARIEVTEPCATGRAVLTNLRDETQNKFRFELYDALDICLTSTTVQNVQVVRGQTTTIAVDLTAVGCQ